MSVSTQLSVSEGSDWVAGGIVMCIRLAPIAVATVLAVALVVDDPHNLTVALGAFGVVTAGLWVFRRREPILLLSISTLGLAFLSANVTPSSTVERSLLAIGFASGLYLLHATATFVVVTSDGAAIERRVLIRVASRTVVVAALGAAIAVWSLLVAQRAQPAEWLAYVGLFAVVVTGAMPIAAVRWRRGGRTRP